MKSLAHISDVHFGRENPALVAGLLTALHHEKPDAIVVSGDLTQRARKSQFRAARAFLDQLPGVPLLVVPGNHDVSATNLYDRLAHPLKRYRKFITADLSPFIDDPSFTVAGINTVRLLARKDGRINRKQVEYACAQLRGAQRGAVRVVVTHHPMDLPPEDRNHALVARSKMAMRAFSACGVDLFLSGHLHTGQTIVTAPRYGAAGRVHTAAVVAQAGTAVSTRTRGQANAWNLIRLDGREVGARMVVEQRVWSVEVKQFVAAHETAFERRPEGWTPIDHLSPGAR